MARSIHILNVSSLQPHELEKIVEKIRAVFTLPVQITNDSLNLDQAYDSSRRQYNSTALLVQILSLPNPKNDKKITIVDVDLYIPILTFVFGEAQLQGHAAIVSFHRLSNQFYGMKPNQALTHERLEKEIIHELCHTFGLVHCHQFECVLRSSTYVEEIDLKRNIPCPSCSKLLWERVNLFYQGIDINIPIEN